MSKRILGLVMALCLVVGMLPMIAIADDPADVTATLTVTTGSNAAKVQWEPTLAAGMTPAYAKTTAEGALVLDGASESDYNLKVEWPADGKPTLTMNGATLNNDTHHRSDSDPAVCHTVVIGGTADFGIVLKGTNVINGNHKDANTTTASHRAAAGIHATNKAPLTIKSLDKATDTLLIDNYGGNGIYKGYDALLIENANVTIHLQNTAAPAGGTTNPHNGIVMAYTDAGCEDKTDLTVTGSTLTILGVGKYLGNNLIIMGKTASYSAANTGDVLFKNSKIVLNRNNGSSANSSDAEAVRVGPNSSFTIDRCDFELYGNHRSLKYVPTFVNCTNVQNRTGWSTWAENTLEPGTALTSNTNNSAFKATHTCGTAVDDFDCTTANTCDNCGATLGGAAQTAHTPAADDGDCTTAVKCANAGCKQEVVAAKTHVAAADDGDCTTAVKCANAGCEHVVTPAAASHTSPADRTSCDQAAKCDVCGKDIPAGEHTGGTATCRDKATCDVCGQPYGEVGTHAGGTATCTKKANCDTCGEEYGDFAPHTEGTPATCKDKAVCSVCSQPYGELSTEHVPETDDGDCTTAIKCSVCGGEAVAAKTHTFTNSIDTTCDNVGCTHTRVVEPKPDFTLTYVTEGGDGPTGPGKATLIMKAGDATKYYTTGQYDTANPNNWYMKETADTANWNIKIEYAADGIPTVTLKGAKIQNRAALQFGGWDAAYEGPTKVVIEGDSLIMNTVAYGGKYPQRSALNFNTKGDNDDVTITSVNNAKLTIATNCNGEALGGISTKGNLILDNANIEIMTSEYNSNSNGIAVNGGNLIIKGGTLKITGYDDTATLHAPNKDSGYTRNTAAMYSGLYVTKDAANEAKAGNITIEGGAKVSIAVSVVNMKDSKNASQAIFQDGTFTIKDSDVEIGLIGKCEGTAKLFAVKPTLEFTNNSYTVTATKTKKPTVTKTVFTEANDSTYSVTIAPDMSKAVDWAETTSLGSITYFRVTAGGAGSGSGSTGGSGGSSSPNTGDISVLLTAGLALASAVGMGGMTVLRKKNG